MAEYIDREAAIAKLTALEATEPNATMADAKRVLADMPGAEAVSLHDIYRVIAGHSYYHGDRILAALSCIVEGKEVNPVRPTDLAPVVHGRWIPFQSEAAGDIQYCSACEIGFDAKMAYCPNCGAKMDIKDGGDNDAVD